MENFSGIGNATTSKTNETVTVSSSIVVFLIALNIFLSVTALLGNTLILVALHKVSCLHPPTKLLFRCLAVSDLCVGLISQPLGVIATMAFITNIDRDILTYVIRVNEESSLILCGLSILVSTAISVDRLLALLLGLRYRHVVTLRRVRTLIICFLLIGLSVGLVYVFWSSVTSLTIALFFVTLSVVLSIISYAKIFHRLRQHQARVQGQVQESQPNGGGILLNIARYKKTVSSIAWVQLALVVCYVPFGISVIMIGINGWSGTNADIVWFSSGTLVYLNSSLNPILYYWKIRDMRLAVRDTVRQLFCCQPTS